MDTIHAIYEGGVFRPTSPVELPEHCEVTFQPEVVKTSRDSGMDEIYAILSERYNSGQSDIAARHNEHQP